MTDKLVNELIGSLAQAHEAKRQLERTADPFANVPTSQVTDVLHLVTDIKNTVLWIEAELISEIKERLKKENS